MTIVARPRHAFRFRGRSFLALALKPEMPVAGWLAELDQWLARSPGFFTGKPLILDLAGLEMKRADIVALLAELGTREIRIMGIEGAEPAQLDATLPPLLAGGRTAGSVEVADAVGPRPSPAVKATITPPPPPPPAQSLLVEAPVRSGTAINHPDGDVVILGSVASGAEIIAAGSIHVYGALRGRALAGAYGNAGARIFCRRFEAELIAIGGYYKVTDELELRLRQKPVQAWLEGEELKIAMLERDEEEAGKWRKS